jgi:hypothetical protein
VRNVGVEERLRPDSCSEMSGESPLHLRWVLGHKPMS